MRRFKFIPYSAIEPFISEMIRLKVSSKARNEFLKTYQQLGEKIGDKLLRKRASFLSRTLAGFEKNPTYRRYLSLIAWAFKPDLKNIFHPKKYFEGLSLEDKFNRLKEFEKRNKMAKQGDFNFQPMATDKASKIPKKNSGFTRKLNYILKEFDVKKDKESLSEYFEIPLEALETVYNRGLKAFFTSGSRPNVNQFQWAFARMAKFILIYTNEIKKEENFSDEDVLLKYSKGNGIIQDVTQFIKGKRLDYPPKVREYLKFAGNRFITGIMAVRRPIEIPTSIANLLSFNKYKKILDEKQYDDMFHLFLLLKLDNGSNVIVEKNEVINIEPYIHKNDYQAIDISLNNQNMRLSNLLNRTRQGMGDNRFFTYDIVNNNCQIFIKNILKLNNIGNANDIFFIKQDVNTVIKVFPNFIQNIVKMITGFATRINILTEGYGLN